MVSEDEKIIMFSRCVKCLFILLTIITIQVSIFFYKRQKKIEKREKTVFMKTMATIVNVRNDEKRVENNVYKYSPFLMYEYKINNVLYKGFSYVYKNSEGVYVLTKKPIVYSDLRNVNYGFVGKEIEIYYDKNNPYKSYVSIDEKKITDEIIYKNCDTIIAWSMFVSAMCLIIIGMMWG